MWSWADGLGCVLWWLCKVAACSAWQKRRLVVVVVMDLLGLSRRCLVLLLMPFTFPFENLESGTSSISILFFLIHYLLTYLMGGVKEDNSFLLFFSSCSLILVEKNTLEGAKKLQEGTPF